MTTCTRPQILHVIKTINPSSGGVAAVCARLAKEQIQFGVAATIFSQSIGQYTPDGLPLETRGLKKAIQNVDCLHLHGVWDPVLYLAAREARRINVPYLITPHGMLDPWSLKQSRWKKKIALKLGYRKMLDAAACLQALNEDEKDLIQPLGLQCPMVVVPNGVSLAEVDANSSLTEFQVPCLSGRPYILFLGRFHMKKGLDYLAGSFARFARSNTKVQLVVAGPDEGAKADFENRIAEAGLQERVHILNAVFGREKWSLLRNADCFILPSRQEGFSVAVLEAMACRVPVIITTECHFPDVAKANAGFVVPLDETKLAEAMIDIFSNDEFRQNAGMAARVLVETKFTWEKIVYQLNAVYEQITTQRRA